MNLLLDTHLLLWAAFSPGTYALTFDRMAMLWTPLFKVSPSRSIRTAGGNTIYATSS